MAAWMNADFALAQEALMDVREGMESQVPWDDFFQHWADIRICLKSAGKFAAHRGLTEDQMTCVRLSVLLTQCEWGARPDVFPRHPQKLGMLLDQARCPLWIQAWPDVRLGQPSGEWFLIAAPRARRALEDLGNFLATRHGRRKEISWCHQACLFLRETEREVRAQ